eukprot:gene1942-1180_t
MQTAPSLGIWEEEAEAHKQPTIHLLAFSPPASSDTAFCEGSSRRHPASRRRMSRRRMQWSQKQNNSSSFCGDEGIGSSLVVLRRNVRLLGEGGVLPRGTRRKNLFDNKIVMGRPASTRRPPATDPSDVSAVLPLPSHLRHRAVVSDPTTVTHRFLLTFSQLDVRDRSGLEAAVLREVLHKHLDACAASPSSTDPSSPPCASGFVVRVEDIVPHTDTARPAAPQSSRGSGAAGNSSAVCMAVSATLTLAKVIHGITAGVAEELIHGGECMLVRLPSSSGSTPQARKRARNADASPATDETAPEGESKDESGVIVMARVGEAEVAQPGQAVLVVAEAGSISCIGIRPPRVARMKFSLPAPVTAGNGPCPEDGGFTQIIGEAMEDPAVATTA